ncbi:MAG: bifunctional (p)ppGpp synthetase/guanosine-3',5'-bis(diphosphate) 3'-pyrophosphohydrolase [Burkholderiaceae bacterium]
MKTGVPARVQARVKEQREPVATIVRLSESGHDAVEDSQVVERARAFAEPLLRGHVLESGEPTLAHADAAADILHGIGASTALRATVYLSYAADYLKQPEEAIGRAFGDTFGSLVAHTRKLVQILRSARDARVDAEQRVVQAERVRKMLLAFSRDLRVVLLRLASRLQTLRYFAATKQPCPRPLADESLQVFAPLANRLGIWQFKWEIEDLSFRFLDSDAYRSLSRLLEEKRIERELGIEVFRREMSADLARHAIRAEVTGRPKHIYSIWKKMQGKGLAFDEVFDIRAVRVIVASVAECYAALARVQEHYPSVAGSFDDYIAKPKANGYQSLHTVVRERQGRPVEIQIRTREMHERAEHGAAAHWAYKEAAARGYSGVSTDAEFTAKVAQARKAVLRQLLAWERDFIEIGGSAELDDRIYVFTPAANVIELPSGATPIDFAYAVHSELGHRCRGAKLDGAMVPLNTALLSGQTVEIVAAKEGGPSLDWLNSELRYLRSPRARAKVRAWFNSVAQRETVARGRELVAKLLQREGKASTKLDDLATRLGFRNADALFERVGKDEFSIRNIETLLRPAEAPATHDDTLALKRPQADGRASKGGVLVAGVESLLTSLARCCRPAPPDAIGGYVTRGKGVAVHRTSCVNFQHLSARTPQRTIAVAWSAAGVGAGEAGKMYPIDVMVEAADRHGLLRDVSEIFAKEKMNVVGVHSDTDKGGETTWMAFTIEVSNAARLASVLAQVGRVDGVLVARRK